MVGFLHSVLHLCSTLSYTCQSCHDALVWTIVIYLESIVRLNDTAGFSFTVYVFVDVVGVPYSQWDDCFFISLCD